MEQRLRLRQRRRVAASLPPPHRPRLSLAPSPRPDMPRCRGRRARHITHPRSPRCQPGPSCQRQRAPRGTRGGRSAPAPHLPPRARQGAGRRAGAARPPGRCAPGALMPAPSTSSAGAVCARAARGWHSRGCAERAARADSPAWTMRRSRGRWALPARRRSPRPTARAGRSKLPRCLCAGAARQRPRRALVECRAWGRRQEAGGCAVAHGAWSVAAAVGLTSECPGCDCTTAAAGPPLPVLQCPQRQHLLPHPQLYLACTTTCAAPAHSRRCSGQCSRWQRLPQ
jgi:hypothetical protein